MLTHHKYIRRCIELAKNGFGNTYPNPMVGSVVVYNDEIIGEGWHEKAGLPHAEVNAIKSVTDASLLKRATIYVSLEPCSHYGKTPPCADLIIASKIPNVIIGTIDPNKKVAGSGIKKLLDAGCKVTVGVLEEACINLNKRFFTFHQKKRPYLLLKWAQTQDGFIAPDSQKKGEPFWITNNFSKQLVHKWRSEEQAILVGTSTAIKDNPQLNVRLWEGKNPVRVVIDRALRISASSYLLDNTSKTIVFTEKNTISTENTIYETIDFSKNIASQICEVLYQHNIQSLIVEGGSKTLQTFIDGNLWDEARVFTGNKQLYQGLKAPEFNNKPFSKEKVKDDTLTIYHNSQ